MLKLVKQQLQTMIWFVGLAFSIIIPEMDAFYHLF